MKCAEILEGVPCGSSGRHAPHSAVVSGTRVRWTDPDRVEALVCGRLFVFIRSSRDWDVYRTRDGHMTRVFLTGQTDLKTALDTVRGRLTQ